jgi:predicted metal-dependent hydrolase
MEKHIQLKGQKVPYVLRRSRRAQNMRLVIYCDGSFVVTAPESLDFGRIEDFIFKKAEWVLKKLRITEKNGRSLVFARFSKREYEKLKKKALYLAENKVCEFNKIYGFKYERISIRNQKSRWGSCSKKGNLNYNYKITLMPEDLADYIIVHELCHLKEFNHSKNFWSLVAITIPDYRERRKKIKNL